MSMVQIELYKTAKRERSPQDNKRKFMNLQKKHECSEQPESIS